MKQSIAKLSESELLESFPIKGEIDGWYFRINETSSNSWEAEGSDLWGRKIYCQGHDPEELLAEVREMAVTVMKQTNAL